MMLLSMKVKNPGISLLVALGVSALTMVIAMAVLQSVTKTFVQGQGMEQSNQVFFATESGLEAGFYHHNARGAGLVIAGTDIAHTAIDATATWDIDGRATAYTEPLREYQKVEIPLYWDSAADITTAHDPTSGKILNATEPFTLTFNPDAETLGIDFKAPNPPNEVVIDWKLLAYNTEAGTDRWETFAPAENPSGICSRDNWIDYLPFVCETNLNTIAKTEIISNAFLKGQVLPGNTTPGFNDFYASTDHEKYKLSFQALLPFEDSASDTTISGIPLSLSFTRTPDFPQPFYHLTATVNKGAYQRSRTLTIPERTTLSAFDYVILD